MVWACLALNRWWKRDYPIVLASWLFHPFWCWEIFCPIFAWLWSTPVSHLIDPLTLTLSLQGRGNNERNDAYQSLDIEEDKTFSFDQARLLLVDPVRNHVAAGNLCRVVVNNRALLVYYEGSFYFPIYGSIYPGERLWIGIRL